MKAKSGRNGQRQRARGGACRRGSQMAEESAVEVDESEQARGDPQGEDESHGGKRWLARVDHGGLDRPSRVGQDVPEEEDEDSGRECVKKSLNRLRQASHAGDRQAEENAGAGVARRAMTPCW